MAEIDNLEIIYHADLTSPSGYSVAARDNMRAILEAGVNIKGINRKHDSMNLHLGQYWSRRMPIIMSQDISPWLQIWQETPEFYSPDPDSYDIGFPAWETTMIPNFDISGEERLNWVKQLNKMDEVWCPSTFCRDAYKASGVTKDIYVMETPVDIDLYNPSSKRVAFYDSYKNEISFDNTIFMSVFQWTHRKNPRALLFAYFTEFSPSENVFMVIKTYGNNMNDTQRIYEYINEIKSSLKLPSYPKYGVVSEMISEDDIPVFYNSCDVLVSSTRGEGMGMPMLQAMSCGKPVIATGFSSLTDFINEDNGYPVKYTLEPVHGMGHIPWYMGYQEWAAIDIKDLKRRMREAHENIDARKNKGAISRATIEKSYCYKTVGEKMRSRIRQIYQNKR